jgi:hypothetical protein
MTLWIAGQSLGVQDTWQLLGVFDSEDKAEAAAIAGQACFVAPATLNCAYPAESSEWAGLRWVGV